MIKSGLRAGKEAVRSLGALSLVPLVNAQVAQKVDVSTVDKTTTAISNVANALGVVLFALAAIFILIAGFFYLTAAGNQTQLDKAKNTLIYAIVGIVLGLIAFSVPTLVKNFLS